MQFKLEDKIFRPLAEPNPNLCMESSILGCTKKLFFYYYESFTYCNMVNLLKKSDIYMMIKAFFEKNKYTIFYAM